MADVAAPVEEKEEVNQFVGGEIHIVADGKSGGISVSAPPNMVVAFGLLEVAKAILMEKQRENAAAKAPVVRPATMADVKALDRKPS